jgi:hypothetical protein
MHNTIEEHPARAHIQKELISNLMRKNRRSEIRDLGQLWRSKGNAIPKQVLNEIVPDG